MMSMELTKTSVKGTANSLERTSSTQMTSSECSLEEVQTCFSKDLEDSMAVNMFIEEEASKINNSNSKDIPLWLSFSRFSHCYLFYF